MTQLRFLFIGLAAVVLSPVWIPLGLGGLLCLLLTTLGKDISELWRAHG